MSVLTGACSITRNLTQGGKAQKAVAFLLASVSALWSIQRQRLSHVLPPPSPHPGCAEAWQRRVGTKGSGPHSCNDAFRWL